RLISTAVEREHVQRDAPTFVGRTWEINTVTALLDEAVSGVGSVINVVGPPGMGKSRLTHEAAALAADRGMAVIATYCESHASDIPFYAVARLLRAGLGVAELDPASACAHVRAQVPDADPEDVLLLDDLLGIADPAIPGPVIEPDARRRRLTALINAVTLSRTTPALFVIEDVHWIDEVSESMLTGFLTVIPQSRSAVLITYRPEYQGALARIAAAQPISLRPLSDANTSALIHEVLGAHPSVAGLAEHIAAVPRVTHFSPRRWCATSLDATFCTAGPAITCCMERSLRLMCPPHCRPPSQPALTDSRRPLSRH
ncbi:MAG: AAA family ATPase, partial [Burkholderiales bacterium]